MFILYSVFCTPMRLNFAHNPISDQPKINISISLAKNLNLNEKLASSCANNFHYLRRY